MKLMKAVKTAVISAAMLSGTTAFGAGFQLTEQGVTGLGRSYAGAGIVGDDLSAVAHNPAGMTLLSGTRVQQNAVLVSLDFEYSGKSGQTENGRDTPTVIPSGIITHQLNENVWLGLGITVPYGLKVRYGSDWEGNAKGISAGITTIDFNPSIAWKLNDHVSIGAGVSAIYARAKLKNSLPLKQALGVDGEFEYKGDDWAFTYDLGVMVTPIETLRFGVSYRSAAKIDADGDYTLRGLTPLGLGGTVDGGARLETPETVMISGTWEATDKLRLSGLIRWSNWRNFDKIDFSANESFGVQTDSIIQGISYATKGKTDLSALSIENNWKAAWLFTLGADYEVNDQWTVRGGIGLETDPIKHQYNRTALIPDTKRLWLSCGFSYMPNKNWQFDVAYAHLRGIGNDKLYAYGSHETVQGKFNQTNAWLVGAAIQYHF